MSVPGGLPKYLQICDVLAREIEAGVYPPGSRLPAQRALAERFGVTLMTLRQAIGLLETEGLVSSLQGRGTFAGRPSSPDETQVLGYGVIPAPPDVARRLGIDPGGEVFVIERLHLHGGEPAVAQCSYLPTGMGLRLAVETLATRSLHEALADAGVLVAWATETIRCVVLDSIDAAALGREAGAAALLSRRLAFDAGDTPVAEEWAIVPGERVVLTADRVALGHDGGPQGGPGPAYLDYSITGGAAMSASRRMS